MEFLLNKLETLAKGYVYATVTNQQVQLKAINIKLWFIG